MVGSVLSTWRRGVGHAVGGFSPASTERRKRVQVSGAAAEHTTSSGAGGGRRAATLSALAAPGSQAVAQHAGDAASFGLLHQALMTSRQLAAAADSVAVLAWVEHCVASDVQSMRGV